MIRQCLIIFGCLAVGELIASNTSLKHLGYQVIKEFTRAGKRRNLLVLDLTSPC